LNVSSGNLTSTIALLKIIEDDISDTYEVLYQSDLISLLCELGGFAFFLGFIGRTFTSIFSRRLLNSSIIRKTMQIKG